MAALVAGHPLGIYPENLRGGGPVDVGIFGERGEQPRVLGQVGHDTQFDLGVVGGQQEVARFSDECLPDPATVRGADRDVLQVGVAG